MLPPSPSWGDSTRILLEQHRTIIFLHGAKPDRVIAVSQGTSELNVSFAVPCRPLLGCGPYCARWILFESAPGRSVASPLFDRAKLGVPFTR